MTEEPTVDLPLDDETEPLAVLEPVALVEVPEHAAVQHPTVWEPDGGDEPDPEPGDGEQPVGGGR